MTDAATSKLSSRTDARKAFGLAHGYDPFSCVLADPPWSYGCKAPTESPRPHLDRGEQHGSADHYYPTMGLGEIKALPVREISANDSVCFMWATVPLLPSAFEVMDAWGFKYKTMLTWHKINSKGMGYWFRGYTEHLLLGVRGNVKAFRSLQHNLVESKVGRHSEKPERFHEIIESVTTGPRIELFARRKRAGWCVWGNEIEADLLSA